MQTPTLPQLAQPVFYCDDERMIHAAIITGCHPPEQLSHIVNLIYFQHTGRYRPGFSVQRATHDGTKWRILNRWFPYPQDEYDTTTPRHDDFSLFKWPTPTDTPLRDYNR